MNGTAFPAAHARWRIAGLTALALCAFSANSLLCRLALRPAHDAGTSIDATSFTLLRLAAGALVLWPLAVHARRGSGAHAPRLPGARRWLAPGLLFAYAIGFALAYVRIDAASGALLLFAAVQLTMLAAGVRGGERPGGWRLVGMALALGGLALLLVPGHRAAPIEGALLMLFAGAAWGGYSLLGRGSTAPVADTARNFLLAVPLALLAAGAAAAAQQGGLQLSARGAVLAIASGALASGLGYVVWYAALRGLSASAAAVVQLAVPPLTAAAAIPLLGEAPSLRLLLASVVVLGGVALALAARTGSVRSREAVTDGRR